MFRRGKLSLLSTKDDRVKIFLERISLSEKHMLEMYSTFVGCTYKMAKFRNSYDDLAKSIKTYADDEEVNESLSEGLKNFTNAITILGDYMDVNVHRMEKKIMGELASFDILCKATRDNLRASVIARDKEVLKQRQMLELKAKFSANNTAADSELLKAKLEVSRANKEIDEIISNFEKRKLSEIKTILTNFILISMKYHTKALEALTASYYDVSNIDVEGDFKQFQKFMKTKEESQQRKSALKKGLRSQSMDSLDRDQLLSPLRNRAKLSRSSRNLANDEEEDEKEDEDSDDDEDEDEDESTENSNMDDGNSVSPSEDGTDSASDAKASTKNTKKTNSKTKMKLPFRAVAATHVLKQKQANRLDAKRSAGILSIAQRNSLTRLERDSKSANSVELSLGGRQNSGGVVTVVESKKSNTHFDSQEAINLSNKHHRDKHGKRAVK